MYSEKYMERLHLMRSALNFEHTNRVPTISTICGWQVFDSPYHFEDVYYDFSVARKVVTEFIERYQFDCYSYTFATHALNVTRALGGGSYVLDPINGGLSVLDHNYLFPEEYEEYAKDPAKFMKICFARKYPDMTTEKFAGAISEFLRFAAWGNENYDLVTNKLESPIIYNSASGALPGLEFLNASLRGIKDIAVDIRRHKSKLKVYLDAQWEKVILPGFKAWLEKPSDDAYVVDTNIAMLAHSFLSVKQFEELYWPYMKQAIDLCVEKNKTMYVNCENSMMRFKEFFQEVPKGTMMLLVEDDDIREVRKVLPNVCLIGGMPIEHLGYGTKEQCVDDAKRLIDDMGEGYILGLTKCAAYKNDVKRENLLAVMDFCHNYTL